MLTTIIFLALKRLYKRNPALAQRILFILYQITRVLFILLLFLLISQWVTAQIHKLEFSVMRKGNNIGSIILERNIKNSQSVIRLQSTIRVRMLVTFNIKANEEATYVNNILTQSSVKRVVNGEVNSLINTRLFGTTYRVNKNGKQVEFGHYPIRFNILQLYFTEPVNIEKIYSDVFHQWVSVEKSGGGRYIIRMPDGSKNEYQYQNGVCVRIFHQQRLISTTLELVNSNLAS